MRELLAEGRTAEVFAYGEGTVLKLDRPDWNGLAEYEGGLLSDLADAGLPVARARGTVTAEGRSGVILDRVDGPSLADIVAASSPHEAEELAERFAALQAACNAVTVEGLPDLVSRLRGEIEAIRGRRRAARRAPGLAGGARRRRARRLSLRLPPGQRARRSERVGGHRLAAPRPPDRHRPTSPARWSCGAARPASRWSPSCRAVRRSGRERRGLGDDAVDGWVRVAAGARLAEGFEGEEASWLGQVAAGAVRLFV